MKIAGLDLRQPAAGYRFSLDPFLLAAFVRPRRGERVADLGAGVGVIALLLARRNPSLRAVALEIQPELARHALANARANGLADRCLVVRADLRDAPALLAAGSFDRVVANPPYRAPGSGRVSPKPGRALARAELSFTLAGLAAAAAWLLRPGGTLDVIHLPERLPEVFRTFAERRLEPKRLRLVQPSPGAPPRLCLVSARKGARPGLAVEPPLVVHEAPGRYGAEVAAALAPARAEEGKRAEKPSKRHQLR